MKLVTSEDFKSAFVAFIVTPVFTASTVYDWHQNPSVVPVVSLIIVTLLIGMSIAWFIDWRK